MKILFILLLCLASLCARSQNTNPVYDSILARRLGADEYGMKSYILVILKSGSNEVKDKATRERLFAGHMANINLLVDSGKMVIAGPLGENDKSYRGIFILNASSIDEAKALVGKDPAVTEKLFDAEYYKWYGSAAISEYMPVHRKIEKKSH